MIKFFLSLSVLLAALGLTACGHSTPAPTQSTPAPAPEPVRYSYEVVHTFPHDTGAFTEGLVFLDGHLYESTGLEGQSNLREVDLNSGQVLRQVADPPDIFGEGIAVLGGKVYQLSWQNHQAFVYDLKTFYLQNQFAYPDEGWGLTTDGTSLIASDGSSKISFLDPATLAVQRTIDVTLHGQPVTQLNELEYIKGEIYANVWQTNNILRIDPKTGNVLGVIDFSGLLAPADRTPDTDVLNGIAYDPATDRLFVTGKKWPKLYEVRLKPVSPAPTPPSH